MRSFTDSKGRSWSIALNIAAARRVRQQLGVDLLDANLPEVLKRVFADTVLLCDVLFVIADANAEPNSRVSSEDFGRALHGDYIEKGADALLGALEDFTPSPRARARVGQMLKAVRSEMAKVQDQADAAVEAAIARLASGQASSVSQPSPASSPGDTPSAS